MFDKKIILTVASFLIIFSSLDSVMSGHPPEDGAEPTGPRTCKFLLHAETGPIHELSFRVTMIPRTHHKRGIIFDSVTQVSDCSCRVTVYSHPILTGVHVSRNFVSPGTIIFPILARSIAVTCSAT